MRLHIAALGLLLLSARAAAVPVDYLADPRPAACLDPAGVLTYEDRKKIDELAARAHAGGELVVVVIDSVGGENPRQYAKRLFNKWGLDSSGRNRGVLLLAAIVDRKAEIVLGDGFEPAAATAVTDEVMNRVVVPRFKAADARGAMVEGARALVERLLVPAEGSASSGAASPGVATRAGGWIEEHAWPFGGGLAVLVGAVALFLRSWLRNRPRRCPKCGQHMVKLSETTEDKYLSHAEQVEEQLGSVAYDVWVCRPCKETIKLRYGAAFSEYSQCPGCGHKTMKCNRTILSTATEYSEGSEQFDEHCLNCNHRNSHVRTISRLERRQYRDDSSSSGGSSSSGSSSGGSSSGGSSSGSGSSGSW